MRTTIIVKIGIFILLSLSYIQAKAQYMPVIFDKTYGNERQVQDYCTMENDEVAMISLNNNIWSIIWLDRNGDVVYSLPLSGFSKICYMNVLENNSILITGSSVLDKKSGQSKGCAAIVNRKGEILNVIYGGTPGSIFLKGASLKNGSFVFAGNEHSGNGLQGFVLKTDNTGKELYKYSRPGSAYCDQFEVMGEMTEYIIAAFSGGNGQSGESSFVVRLDPKGKPFYITPIPAKNFSVIGLSANINDGSAIIAGNSEKEAGIIYKIRPEGDIVFEKTFADKSSDMIFLKDFRVSRTGNILVGGSGMVNAHYALMRNDGTFLFKGVTPGTVRGLEMNKVTGESVVTIYEPSSKRGTFVRIHPDGQAEFERSLAGDYDKLHVANNGEVTMLSTEEGRVCLYSSTGTKQFDRYISGNQPAKYRDACSVTSGEILFFGEGSRLVKLGHGLYVSDIKISKPVKGIATAVFTVTLTGYSTNKEGNPVPVTVGYATCEQSATVKNNFSPIQGRLSFTPSRGMVGSYLITQEIEIPIKANNLIEGEKSFGLVLSNPENSYLVKAVGVCRIEDQEAFVRLSGTDSGVEGGRDLIYKLALCKADGTPLVNSTGANIVVDGVYGEGTADALDFDMGVYPRAIFKSGDKATTFAAKTLEDTRYELPKTVVVNFNKIYSMSGSHVRFDSDKLSCSGSIIDQPACISVASLGDHRVNHGVISGFFKISLIRATDGVLLTNATGSNVVVKCVADEKSSAKEGIDYVFTNLHDLTIAGDGNHSSVNVNGVVLYNSSTEEKTVRLKIDSVSNPSGSMAVGISENNSASFKILK